MSFDSSFKMGSSAGSSTISFIKATWYSILMAVGAKEVFGLIAGIINSIAVLLNPTRLALKRLRRLYKASKACPVNSSII